MDATPAPSEPQADDEDAPIVEDVTPAPTEPQADDEDAPGEDGFETLLPGVRYKGACERRGPGGGLQAERDVRVHRRMHENG